ncbi:MAG: SRPBCC family protein [Halobacteriaceae archaeon]
MATVTLTRHVDAPPEDVRAAIRNVEPFMRAAGFDEVRSDGDTLEIAQGMGLVRIELTLDVDTEADDALVYEQREGIFDSMVTRYGVAPADGGSEVTATTEFELGTAVLGSALDATVITRQRTREIKAQFDYLEDLE